MSTITLLHLATTMAYGLQSANEVQVSSGQHGKNFAGGYHPEGVYFCGDKARL